MSRLIKYLGIPVVAVALLVVADTSSANAQGFSLRVGGFGISTGHVSHGDVSHGHVSHGHVSHSFPPHVRTVHPVPVYQSSWGRPSYYHDTTHLDYHQPSLVPHNGHLDYVPGHYDVHRTGHWHH